MMTVAVPLSAFFMFISVLFLSAVLAFLWLSGRLCLGLVIGIRASSVLISSR